MGLADLALMTDSGFGEGAAEPRNMAPFGCEDETALVGPAEAAAGGGGGGAKERARPLDPSKRRASS